jgi:hypothetical protein
MGAKLGLILREEQRLKLFENRVLWRIFGPKRDVVMGEWNLGGIGWGDVEWIGLV